MNKIVVWFLRLFATYRTLEYRFSRLQSAVGAVYPPTTLGLADALGVTARAVVAIPIQVEVVPQRVPGMRSGMVRIIVQEPA